MASDELLSREEVLAGLPARRANTILFLIENQTARISARSRVEFSLTDQVSVERDLAFLQAFSAGGKPAFHPTIQQLERYARQWAALVPDNPRLQAALAHALSQKYSFTRSAIPQIRETLGLDQEPVRLAYYRLYHQSLDTLYTDRLTLVEQWRWLLSAIAQGLESLPAFWLASLVTVALGLPQAFLALPIAVAEVGPLMALGFILAIGLINIITMVCMAEAVGRSGDFRYGNAFIKQLVGNYLGETGASILSIAIGMRVFLIALACYIGLSVTMATFTSIPAPLCAAFLFLAGLYLLSRRSLSFTVALLVLLAVFNVSLLIILSLLSFQHLEPSHLFHFNLPLLAGDSLALSTKQQMFGVSLMLYFGHVYVGECARMILPRDPSGRSLIWGSVAGTAFLTLLFCLWVLAVNGAIAPTLLAEQAGTVLEPLAAEVGPIVTVLGAILVTLLLGMAWMRSSSLLLSIGREWLPGRSQSVLTLPVQQGTLILHPRGNSSTIPRIGITYLGLEWMQPTFRLTIQVNGRVTRTDIPIAHHWHLQNILDQFPDLHPWNLRLAIAVQSATAERVQMQIESSMLLSYDGELRSVGEQPTPATPTPRTVEQITRRFWTYLRQQQFALIPFMPLVLVFLLTEWLFFTGVQSFTNVLAFAGVLGNSLVGGIFPVLLLVSSRQKGELVPGIVFRSLSHPLLQIGIYSLFLAVLLLHGLWIWQAPLARITALGIAILCPVATWVMHRQGAFAPRLVVELHEAASASGRSQFRITAGGRPKVAEVRLGYPQGEQCYHTAAIEVDSLSSLRYVHFHLPMQQEKELRVWTHRSQGSAQSGSLPALVEVESGGKAMQFDLKLSGGQVLLPLDSRTCRLKMTFSSPSV